MREFLRESLMREFPESDSGLVMSALAHTIADMIEGHLESCSDCNGPHMAALMCNIIYRRISRNHQLAAARPAGSA